MVTVNFNLWKDTNPSNPEEAAITNLETEKFRPSEATYVITHGFLNQGGELDSGGNIITGRNPEKWMIAMARALRETDKNANIILVDWQEGAALSVGDVAAGATTGQLIGGLLGGQVGAGLGAATGAAGSAFGNYTAAAINTVEVGSQLANKLQEIGADPQKIELIGHSLGAQVSGYAGFSYQKSTGKQINRITGLDPAGPIFEQSGTDVRLDESDAERVVAIHTSKVFGYDDKAGDLDVYVNWNKFSQPGTFQPIGSHGYATELYGDLLEDDSIPQDNAPDFNLDLLKNFAQGNRLDIDTYNTRFVGLTDGFFNLSANNILTLGTPAGGDIGSYVEFQGQSFNTATNKLFPLGRLTYRNGLTVTGTEPTGDLDFTLKLGLEKPTNQQGDFQFKFKNTATENQTGDPVVDGDKLSFSEAGLSNNRIDTNGTQYTIDLFGFSPNNGFSVLGEFNSPEKSMAEATLFGKITIAESRLIDPLLWDKLRTNLARSSVNAYKIILISSFPPSGLLLLRQERLANSPLRAERNFQNSEITQEEAFVMTEELAEQYPGGVLASEANEQIFGSPVNDVIYGLGGADLLNGSRSDDVLRGGDGNDQIFGGKDSDILNGNRNDDFLSGDIGDDLIRGGKNNDTLNGGEGNDILIGDLGNDFLAGGSGADVFVFRTDTGEEKTDAATADWILDFNAAEGDRIAINGGVPIEILAFTLADVNQDGTADTVVQYTENNQVFGTYTNIFGAVINTAPEVVKNSIFTASVDEPLLQIG